MEELIQKIESIIGRTIEIEEVRYKGQVGFMPIYFNYSTPNFVSLVFDKDKEKCVQKFFDFLTSQSQGEESGTDTETES